jgi:archaellum component FlaG (FlaF/FlaG flagellin family)
MDKKKLATFSLSLYGEVTAFSPTISRARCRIFYKYGNRNGTYITDEFAEKLIASLPYVPVKGIFDSAGQDFTDHGVSRSLGRIYGIVPVEHNFAWEDHLDEDGVTRNYACCDVLLYTAIYQKEALDIVNCGQSMELYVDSIDGEWQYINGKKYFVFTEGCFLGLQALGKEFEPCFEGAGFYSLLAEELANRMQQFELLPNSEVGGEERMNFKLSDNQKYDMIWTLLNSRFNEENGYIIDYAVCEVYDSYAITFKYETGSYERAYYIKDDSTDSLSIDKMEVCYIVDVNENEKKALDVLHQMNGDTYEKVDENYTAMKENVDTLTEEKAALEADKETFSQKIEEHETTISTLQQEKADVENELNDVKGNFENAQSTIQTLTEEKEALETFKANVLKEEKEAVIAKYTTLLDAEVISTFQAKIDEMTKENLERDLAYELVQSQPSLFTHDNEDPGYVPKDNELTGIDGIISRYKK